MVLDVALFKRHGTDSAAAFLHVLYEKHDCSETVFSRIARLSDCNLSIRVERSVRLHTDTRLKRSFQTFKMRIDHFHNSWWAVG
ncbi:integrase catalytic subunit [Halogranum salarium B-1]|uniref:Integrase catalytic subunit n=1 Tax=Halogranum salarium B-1 TaxID=1210908 RepID=J3JCR2_9EURY|nr:integrase catalytic subunit [Halogranum salarium B-1]